VGDGGRASPAWLAEAGHAARLRDLRTPARAAPSAWSYIFAAAAAASA